MCWILRPSLKALKALKDLRWISDIPDRCGVNHTFHQINFNLYGMETQCNDKLSLNSFLLLSPAYIPLVVFKSLFSVLTSTECPLILKTRHWNEEKKFVFSKRKKLLIVVFRNGVRGFTRMELKWTHECKSMKS